MVPGGMNRSARGMNGIAQHNKQVNDYANSGRPSKAPDKIGPPLSYMEECRDVQTLGHHSESFGSL